MLCPTCREKVDETTLSCASGHEVKVQDGVLELLSDAFRHRLDPFMKTFSRLRDEDGMRVMDEQVYDRLPEVDVPGHEHEWRLRRLDWELVRRLLATGGAIGGAPRRILDVGAWNGWLSNRLTEAGHEVTAVDYFADPYDGLRAMGFYPRRWRAIQMDLEDLSLLDEPFDVVVLNRCTHFFVEPAAFVRRAIGRLGADGLLIATGLPFYRRTAHKVEQMRALRDRYRAHGIDFFKPVRGYLDARDRDGLVGLGVTLQPYRALWRSNLRARWLSPQKPLYAWASWRREA